MGKKDKNKKKGLGKAKTLEKTSKKEAKRAKKAKELSGEKDVEELLEEIIAREQAELEVEAIECDAPSPRVNFTMAVNPVKDSELIVYGGEKFDGNATIFFSDLFRFSTEKETWTRYRSKNQPPPRSSHAVATHRNFMYLFGGEFSSPRQTQFYHYRDLWRLDVTDFSWEKIEARGGPTARSGHRMAVCQDKLLVFGGFFDTVTSMKYLNDLFMIDLSLDELKWEKIEIKIGQEPSPRSGFSWISTGSEMLLYGGYCKEKVKGAKSLSHKDKKRLGNTAGEVPDDVAPSRGIVHSEIWKFDPTQKRWEKLKRSGYGPSNRCGFGMVLYKGQLVTFGGVEDEETEENLSSTFYNDIFAYNVARRKWYPMTLRKKKSGAKKKRRRAKAAADSKEGSQGEVADANVEEGTAVGELTLDGDDEDMDVVEVAVADDEEDDVDALEEELIEEEDDKPIGRFNAAVGLLKGSKLVIYGGMYEKGDQEITLDDMWTVDLGKLDEFVPIKPLTVKDEWKASESEEESDSEQEEILEADEDGSEGEDDDVEDEEEAERKEQRKKRKSTLEKRLVGEDDLWTPRVGETLKVFFERTKLHWMEEVYEATEATGKENRGISFQWARQRFEEIKPTLKELEDLEEFFRAEQEAEEQHQKKEADIRRSKARR